MKFNGKEVIPYLVIREDGEMRYYPVERFTDDGQFFLGAEYLTVKPEGDNVVLLSLRNDEGKTTLDHDYPKSKL